MEGGGRETIIVVEDERKIADIVKAYLEREGYTVRLASTGGQALDLFREPFDLVILDLMLPDMQGEDLCGIIRERSDAPIIMLTARSAEEDRIRGLGIGADDYVVKPFSPRELTARVKAQLRRSGRAKRRVMRFNGGGLTIDLETREVLRKGEPVVLTPTEFKILLALAERPGRIFSREQLINIIQGYDFEGSDRTIEIGRASCRERV